MVLVFVGEEHISVGDIADILHPEMVSVYGVDALVMDHMVDRVQELLVPPVSQLAFCRANQIPVRRTHASQLAQQNQFQITTIEFIIYELVEI